MLIDNRQIYSYPVNSFLCDAYNTFSSITFFYTLSFQEMDRSGWNYVEIHDVIKQNPELICEMQQ